MSEREELLAENKKLVNKKRKKLEEMSPKQKAVVYQRANKKKSTKSERKMAHYLNKNKFNFEPQKIFFYGDEKKYFYLCDFYLPDQKIVIEVDGKYHNTPEQQKRDWYKDQHYTKKCKLKLLRITNNKLSSLSIRSFKDILKQLIESPVGSSVYLK